MLKFQAHTDFGDYPIQVDADTKEKALELLYDKLDEVAAFKMISDRRNLNDRVEVLVFQTIKTFYLKEIG